LSWRALVTPKPPDGVVRVKRDKACKEREAPEKALPSPPKPLPSASEPSLARAVFAVEADPTVITIQHWGRLLDGELFASSSSRLDWAVLLKPKHQHCAHESLSVTVHYRWHPQYSQTLRAARRVVGGREYFRCELPHGRTCELPSWMMDAAACARHAPGPSVASIEALVVLMRLLESVQSGDVDGTPVGGESKEATDEVDTRVRGQADASDAASAEPRDDQQGGGTATGDGARGPAARGRTTKRRREGRAR
jgi:hypothetical protein